MDHNRDPRKVRPLDEEMKAIGLNPERTIGAMERNVMLLNQGSLPRDISGLPEGSDDVPRSIREVGAQLREDASEADTIINSSDKAEGEEPSDGDIHVTEEELGEAFKVVRRMIRTAAQKLKNKRAYRKVRSSARKYAKQYYRRFKRKIAKKRKRLRSKFGGEAGLKRARAGGKKRITTQMSGLDAISNIREELARAEAAKVEAQDAEVESHDRDLPVTPYEEAVIKAGLLLMYTGEVFEDVEESAAAAMFDLSDGAAELAEEIAGVEEIDDDTMKRMESLFIATSKVMKAHHSIGSPMPLLVFEAIDMIGDALDDGLSEEIDELIEKKAKLESGDRFAKLSEQLEQLGASNPAALAAWIGREKYGKEKMSIKAEEEDSEGGAEGADE